MAIKKSKLDFKNIAINTLSTAGGAAVASVLDKAVFTEDTDMGDYIKLAVGVVLPAVVKNQMVEKASDAMLAIGAYRLSNKYLIDKLGITGVDNLPTQNVIGAPINWIKAKTASESKQEPTPGQKAVQGSVQ